MVECCDRVLLKTRTACAPPATAGEKRRRREASLLQHPGLAQPFEHVGVIFGSHPRYAIADVHIEGVWCHQNSLLQRDPRLNGWPPLAERRSNPAVGWRKSGVRLNCLSRAIRRASVIARKIQA